MQMTFEELSDIHPTYGEMLCNASAARRRYAEKCPNRHLASEPTLLLWIIVPVKQITVPEQSCHRSTAVGSFGGRCSGHSWSKSTFQYSPNCCWESHLTIYRVTNFTQRMATCFPLPVSTITFPARSPCSSTILSVVLRPAGEGSYVQRLRAIHRRSNVYKGRCI
jgi:hypothetical protein